MAFETGFFFYSSGSAQYLLSECYFKGNDLFRNKSDVDHDLIALQLVILVKPSDPPRIRDRSGGFSGGGSSAPPPKVLDSETKEILTVSLFSVCLYTEHFCRRCVIKRVFSDN